MKPTSASGYGTIEWFDREYGKVSGDPWGLEWRPSQLVRYQRVLGRLQTIDAPVESILDVGCSTGDFTHLLSRHLPGLTRLLGVDFVDSAIQRAAKRFPDLTFARESIFSIGTAYREQFDLVACLEVLYYVDPLRRAEALKSLRAALRPGGYAVFSSLISQAPHFSPQELEGLVEGEFEVLHSEILHLKLVSLLEKVGDRVQRLTRRVAGTRNVDGASFRIGRLPLPAVVVIEKWSRLMRSPAASHTIVLARARA